MNLLQPLKKLLRRTGGEAEALPLQIITSEIRHPQATRLPCVRLDRI